VRGGGAGEIEVIQTAVGIFGQRGVAQPIRIPLAGCSVCFTSQIVVCYFSHEDNIVGHLQRLFRMLRDEGRENRTHSGYKRICGEVIGVSGNLTGMNLTGSGRELEPGLRYQAKTSATYLGIREGWREHRLVVIVGGEKRPEGWQSPMQVEAI